MKEKIMVAERSVIFKGDYFQGFKPHKEVDFEKRILEHHHYMIREDAEHNPNFKQPIAYAVIFNPKSKKVFLYRRSVKDKEYKEKRLQGKWSVGIGGHIEKQDVMNGNPIQRSLFREINEEVEIKGLFKLKVLGYINDDDDSVGRVHFGILYIVETNGDIKPKDKALETGSFVQIKEIKKMNKTMETWSQLALEAISRFLLH